MILSQTIKNMPESLKTSHAYLVKPGERVHNHSMLLHNMQDILIHNALASSCLIKVNYFNINRSKINF